jgi:hypothetical protein
MNLRQQLLEKAKLRSCSAKETQLRNFPEKSATTTATTAQQTTVSPRGIRVSSATGDATTPQQASCAPRNRTQPKANSCATVADAFDDRVTCTACRSLWPGNRCLNHRRAGLTTRELAAEFVELKQRCYGFAPLARAQSPPAPANPFKTDTDRPTTDDHQLVQPILKDTDMILTDTGGSAFTPCPAGSYLARCVQLIDLGTQTSNFEGEVKRARKVLVAWEILDDECRKDDGSPFILSKRFTQSLHEKAALRKMLEAWRNRTFSPVELKGFDLGTVLGKDAFLSVIHTDKEGKTFANIAAVMKPPKGMTAPEGTGNEPLVQWDMAAPDWAVFAALTPRLVEQIESSPEFKSLTPPAGRIAVHTPAPTRTHTPAAAPVGTVGSGFDDLDDDVPF